MDAKLCQNEEYIKEILEEENVTKMKLLDEEKKSLNLNYDLDKIKN